MSDYVLDANVVVRFLTQDDPKQSQAATALLLKASSGEVTLHLESSIISEVVYVLESSRYHKTREEIHDALIDLVRNPGIETDAQDVVIDALRRFRAHPALDFPDCLIAAIALHRNMPVASFDRDLDRFKDVHRHEPQA